MSAIGGYNAYLDRVPVTGYTTQGGLSQPNYQGLLDMQAQAAASMGLTPAQYQAELMKSNPQYMPPSYGAGSQVGQDALSLLGYDNTWQNPNAQYYNNPVPSAPIGGSQPPTGGATPPTGSQPPTGGGGQANPFMGNYGGGMGSFAAPGQSGNFPFTPYYWGNPTGWGYNPVLGPQFGTGSKGGSMPLPFQFPTFDPSKFNFSPAPPVQPPQYQINPNQPDPGDGNVTP